MNYATPDWGPKSCEVTYGGELCVCDISGDTDNANFEPCYTWDCTEVEGLPEPLKPFLKSTTCKNLSWEQIGESTLDDTSTGNVAKSNENSVSVTSFLPSIEQVPDDVTADLEASNNNVVSDTNNDNKEDGSGVSAAYNNGHYVVSMLSFVVVCVVATLFT